MEILECINGKIVLDGISHSFSKLSIDTRKISGEDIFLAISGVNFDGNKYISTAFENGIKLCIVDKVLFNEEDFIGKDFTIILVENTIDALENMAILVRSKLKIDLIGVTGSVGKTTTKDLIYSFLNSKYNVYRVLGNFNNQLGLPISLINIDDDAEIGIFELGMRGLGEIDYLAKILKPTIGVITNIGISHIEFLKSKENIFKSKMEITNYFNNDSILILNNEDEFLSNVFSDDYRVYKVGLSKSSDMIGRNLELNSDSIKFNAIYNGKNEEFDINICGKHNILNSLIGLKLCEIFKIDIEILRKSFSNIQISNMRQDIVKYKNMIIINDCYNASPKSMESSIDVLSLYEGEKVCILGDMMELGEEAYFYHGEVSKYANGKVNKFIAIGNFREAYYNEFIDKENCYCFESIYDFQLVIKNILKGDENILIKASRSAKFERIEKIIKDKF